MRLDDRNLGDYLVRAGLAPAGTSVRVEVAGEGNINFVRRVVRADASTLVIKQARPELERFPEYQVTPERLDFEVRYLRTVREIAPDVAGLLAEVLHYDREAKILVMEDLGPGPDLGDLLAAGEATDDTLHELGRFLGAVHAESALRALALRPAFANEEMRRLHGEHIFSLPFEPNDFPIAEGLAQSRQRLLDDAAALERIRALRRAYYEGSAALVHGDVQSGNILVRDGRPRLVDAEIAHFGDPAFDLGTALAHVHFHVALGDARVAERARSAGAALLGGYAQASGSDPPARASGYAAVEMLRRTLGAARLPHLAEPGAARATLEHATALLVGTPLG